MSQDNLSSQVGAAVARKGLDEQKLEGQNVVQLIDSAQPGFADPLMGSKIDTRA